MIRKCSDRSLHFGDARSIFFRAVIALLILTVAPPRVSGSRLRVRTAPFCTYGPRDGHDGQVRVNIRENNFRAMEFQTNLPQTEVQCKGGMSCSPPNSTGPARACESLECPCEADTSEIRFPWTYMQRMMNQTVPLCNAAGSRSQNGDPFRILLIGLGGGVLPMYALDHCPKGTQIDNVEYDPRVIDAASRFFGFRVIDNVNTVECNDCAVAVRARLNQTRKYDVVLIDAFQEEYVPPSCREHSFISDLSQVLKPQGRVVQHISWSHHDGLMEDYRQVFGREKVEGMASFGGNLIVAKK